MRRTPGAARIARCWRGSFAATVDSATPARSSPEATVVMENLDGARREVPVGDLIPWGFGPDDLASFRTRRGGDGGQDGP